MKINTAKRRMLDGGPAIGAEVALGPPLSAELLSQVGFDFVLVDHQHGRWDDENTMYAFRSIALGGSIPNGKGTPQRVQRHRQASGHRGPRDRGPPGQLRRRRRGRGVCMQVSAKGGAGRAESSPPGFTARTTGAGSTTKYSWPFRSRRFKPQSAPRRSCRWTVSTACGSGPTISACPMGVDLGTDAGRKEHEAAIQAVVDACKRANKIPGISCPNAAITQHWTDRGCLFVTTGADSEWAVEGGQEALRKLGR